MAFKDATEKITAASPPVYLMTVTLKNSYRTSFQPKLVVVHIERTGAQDRADKLNFLMDDEAIDESNSEDKGNSYFIRMFLVPGSYEFVALTSSSGIFPIRGMFITPMATKIDSTGAGVYYLGHVAATVRERRGSEFKAGPTLPLIDQAVVGASGGSFDVEISDQLSTDEPSFRARFPALAGVEIKRAILPPFDRAKAQKWWQDH
jgi:hypothetical protein